MICLPTFIYRTNQPFMLSKYTIVLWDEPKSWGVGVFDWRIGCDHDLHTFLEKQRGYLCTMVKSRVLLGNGRAPHSIGNPCVGAINPTIGLMSLSPNHRETNASLGPAPHICNWALDPANPMGMTECSKPVGMVSRWAPSSSTWSYNH